MFAREMEGDAVKLAQLTEKDEPAQAGPLSVWLGTAATMAAGVVLAVIVMLHAGSGTSSRASTTGKRGAAAQTVLVSGSRSQPALAVATGVATGEDASPPMGGLAELWRDQAAPRHAAQPVITLYLVDSDEAAAQLRLELGDDETARIFVVTSAEQVSALVSSIDMVNHVSLGLGEPAILVEDRRP